MEEEVSQRVVSIAFTAGKLTANVLAWALGKVIAAEKERSAAKARGKASERKTGSHAIRGSTQRGRDCRKKKTVF